MLDDNDILRNRGSAALNPLGDLSLIETVPIACEMPSKSPNHDGQARKGQVVAISAKALLNLNLPKREHLLAPWLHVKDLGMIFAPRGGSKTWVSLGIAAAIAAGGRFLSWQAPKPRPVLYVDGELPHELLQERLRIIMRSLGLDLDAMDNLRIITPDMQTHGMPNIANRDGQAMIEDHLEDMSLMILDNLSCLNRGGVENEAESWDPVQEWLLLWRSRGLTTIFNHHAGRSGNPRGTSKREDVLDHH